MPVMFKSSAYVPAQNRQQLSKKPDLPTLLFFRSSPHSISSQAVSTDSYTSVKPKASPPEAELPTRNAHPPMKNALPKTSRNRYNRTPLMQAAQSGDLAWISTFLNRQPFNILQQLINLQDDLENTALHLAVKAGHTKIAKKLLENGADPTIHDVFFQTPLMSAARQGHTDMIHVLLAHDAPINQTSEMNATALMAAAAYGHYQAAHILLHYHANPQKNADPNISNGMGNTALIMAAREGRFSMVRLLVHSGALLHLTNKDGQNAIMIARWKGHNNIADWLEEKAREFGYRVNKRPSLNPAQPLVTLELNTPQPKKTIGFKVERQAFKPADIDIDSASKSNP